MTKTGNKRMRTIDIVLCGLFTALIAVGAFIRITIPTEPYPFTFSLQWLFVLLAGFLLGAKMGAMSVAAYVIIGLAGVPVFVHGGGPQYIFRAGFGFLLGFIPAAFVIGLLARDLGGGTRQKAGGEFVGDARGMGPGHRHRRLHEHLPAGRRALRGGRAVVPAAATRPGERPEGRALTQ